MTESIVLLHCGTFYDKLLKYLFIKEDEIIFRLFEVMLVIGGEHQCLKNVLLQDEKQAQATNVHTQ